MSPTSIQDERKPAIEKRLLLIAGLEASIMNAEEQRDWEFRKQLLPLRKDYYEKLRRLVYGLPEEPSKTSEE